MQDRFTVLQRLIDPRKEGGIVEGVAGTDGIGLVVQMFGCQIGMNRPLVGCLEPQIEDLGDAMIDPDDGVIVNSHDFLLLERRRSQNAAFGGQCDISTGTVIESNMPRVTPPRIRSCNRE